MGSQVYRETYLAALDVAHSDLHHIMEQFDMLQLRKEQLEDVLGALDPFLRSASKAVSHEIRQPEPLRAQPIRIEPEPEVIQPVLHAVPMPEPILDPIQNRINRALGLAVA
ncbi:MAG: hypothetical protein WBQ95_16200 [Terracidiphilus sp.]